MFPELSLQQSRTFPGFIYQLKNDGSLFPFHKKHDSRFNFWKGRGLEITESVADPAIRLETLVSPL